MCSFTIALLLVFINIRNGYVIWPGWLNYVFLTTRKISCIFFSSCVIHLAESLGCDWDKRSSTLGSPLFWTSVWFYEDLDKIWFRCYFIKIFCNVCMVMYSCIVWNFVLVKISLSCQRLWSVAVSVSGGAFKTILISNLFFHARFCYMS